MAIGTNQNAPITQVAYARLVGLSPGRITQLINLGMPTTNRKIDPAVADAWRAEHINPERVDADRRGRIAKRGEMTSRIGASQRITGSTVAATRQKKLEADVELAQLELGKRAGSLVARAEVERFIFAKARQERDSWVSFISRIAPILAHELEVDPQKAFAFLDRVLREHLLELSETSLEAAAE